MNTYLTKSILRNGAFLALAISSRFLLRFEAAIWAQVLDFVVLFAIYSALIMWLREYQKSLPDQKIALKQIIGFSFKVFIIGAFLASLFKFYFYEQIKPAQFAILAERQEESFQLVMKEAKGMLLTAQKANNVNDIKLYNEAISSLNWWRPRIISSYFEPIVTFIINVLGGMLLGWFVWPLFKFSQKNQNPLKQ